MFLPRSGYSWLSRLYSVISVSIEHLFDWPAHLSVHVSHLTLAEHLPLCSPKKTSLNFRRGLPNSPPPVVVDIFVELNIKQLFRWLFSFCQRTKDTLNSPVTEPGLHDRHSASHWPQVKIQDALWLRFKTECDLLLGCLRLKETLNAQPAWTVTPNYWIVLIFILFFLSISYVILEHTLPFCK